MSISWLSNWMMPSNFEIKYSMAVHLAVSLLKKSIQTAWLQNLSVIHFFNNISNFLCKMHVLPPKHYCIVTYQSHHHWIFFWVYKFFVVKLTKISSSCRKFSWSSIKSTNMPFTWKATGFINCIVVFLCDFFVIGYTLWVRGPRLQEQVIIGK